MVYCARNGLTATVSRLTLSNNWFAFVNQSPAFLFQSVFSSADQLHISPRLWMHNRLHWLPLRHRDRGSSMCKSEEWNLPYMSPCHLQPRVRQKSRWLYAKAEVSAQRLQLQCRFCWNVWTASSGMFLYPVNNYPAFVSDCWRTIHRVRSSECGSPRALMYNHEKTMA